MISLMGLRGEMNKFIIKTIPDITIDTIVKYGDVQLDARLWADEYTLYTNLTKKEIEQLYFVRDVIHSE